jgi:predicted transcriptional regulator
MGERLYPYIIFLPKGKKEKVFGAIFESDVPVDVLKFAFRQGISEKIFQKELIATLDYSNKTVIEHLKSLTDLRILNERMEKNEASGRIVWVKYYTLTDLGKWFTLLLVEEEKMSDQEKINIVCTAFRFYTRWVRELSEKLGMRKEELHEIFREEMK